MQRLTNALITRNNKTETTHYIAPPPSSSHVSVETPDNAQIFAELKPTFWKLIGMSLCTKATSVGFKRKSGVETVLLAFHIEELRLIGFPDNLLNSVDFITTEVPTTEKRYLTVVHNGSKTRQINFY